MFNNKHLDSKDDLLFEVLAVFYKTKASVKYTPSLCSVNRDLKKAFSVNITPCKSRIVFSMPGNSQL